MNADHEEVMAHPAEEEDEEEDDVEVVPLNSG
jgi:hypothetical protein